MTVEGVVERQGETSKLPLSGVQPTHAKLGLTGSDVPGAGYHALVPDLATATSLLATSLDGRTTD